LPVCLRHWGNIFAPAVFHCRVIRHGDNLGAGPFCRAVAAFMLEKFSD